MNYTKKITDVMDPIIIGLHQEIEQAFLKNSFTKGQALDGTMSLGMSTLFSAMTMTNRYSPERLDGFINYVFLHLKNHKRLKKTRK